MQETHQRPSLLVPLETDSELACYCFDAAVVAFGTTISNALQETVEVGVGKQKRREDKYTLKQLLDPAFHLPDPDGKRPVADGKALKAWAMGLQAQGLRGGVKVRQAG